MLVVARSLVRFGTDDLLIRLSVNKHKNWPVYPGPPDIEIYRQLQNRNIKSKVADMAAANLSFNGLSDRGND